MAAYGGKPATPGHPVRPTVLWAGGAATALVAFLVAAAGLLVAHGIFDITVLSPDWLALRSETSYLRLPLAAAVSAFVATGLVHLLLVYTPRPMAFFLWIMGLATAVATIWPFGTNSQLASTLASATIYLLIGLAIATLLHSVARRSVVRGPDVRLWRLY